MFGGPWTYADEARGEATGEDAAYLADVTSRIGASIGGRWTYEAARHWGDENPSEMPFFIVTHRPQEQPEGDEFTFVSGVEAAVERAREAAGGKDVYIMGGADVIRQALAAGLVDELTIITAPVVLGGGKRLFEGFSQSTGAGTHRRAAVALRDVRRLPREGRLTSARPGRRCASRSCAAGAIGGARRTP